MGGRGATSQTSNKQLESFISDVNYLSRSDLQSEIEAYVMTKYNTSDPREAMRLSDPIQAKVDDATKFIRQHENDDVTTKSVDDAIRKYAKKSGISYKFLRDQIENRNALPF